MVTEVEKSVDSYLRLWSIYVTYFEIFLQRVQSQAPRDLLPHQRLSEAARKRPLTGMNSSLVHLVPRVFWLFGQRDGASNLPGVAPLTKTPEDPQYETVAQFVNRR